MMPELQEIRTDIAAADASSEISVFDLAVILDQHKLWVESGGEAGLKADFCGVNLTNADLTGANLQGAFLQKANLCGVDLSMANLRGASLVQADLRNANLLGTDLVGANLMGATLYGAEGLWVGRLGGTNLFDAMLPETVAAFDSAKAIAQVTRITRWFYFLMLSVTAACLLLIMLTSDLRLVLDASAIHTTRLGNILPMSGFYLGGPLLLFFISLRFHFLLLRLWSSMAALPAVYPDGQRLENDGPWYLMSLGRRHFRWQKDSRTPQTILEAMLATLVAYWLVPATLFLFWLRYLVRQDFRGTVLHVVLIAAAVACATCLPGVVSRMLRPGDLRKVLSKNVLRMIGITTRAALIIGCILFFISIGVNRGLPADHDIAPEVSRADVRRWGAELLQFSGYRPYADITEASLSTAAPHNDWSEESVKAIRGAQLNQMNLHFARAYRVFLVNARLWRSNLEGAYLSEADLRGANLREARLRSAILDRVQASRTVFVSADARNTNFASADLRGADLSYGIFENSDLSNARVSGASMYSINLRNARLLRTDLSRADLRDTKFEFAVLSFANLQEADLSSAKLGGANLTGAQLKGTILLDADLKKADLRGALLAGAIVRNVEFDGANLEGADLRGVIGINAAQVCSATHGRLALLDPDLLAAVQARCASAQ